MSFLVSVYLHHELQNTTGLKETQVSVAARVQFRYIEFFASFSIN